MSGWRYNFPEHKDVPVNAEEMLRQAQKVMEEAQEAACEAQKLAWYVAMREQGRVVPDAVIESIGADLRRETLDCLQACETQLRAWSPETVLADRDWVEEKNIRRGYYGVTAPAN